MKEIPLRIIQASSFVLYYLLCAGSATGQNAIAPDNSLGSESSIVNSNVDVNGALADLIQGGAIRDLNLFHSFTEFNVGDGGRVYFANPAGIENIFSRVTGGNISEILGTLGVDGGANLYFINPAGIFFGPNARLDLGGSFYGSTADGLLFEDGTVFSANNADDGVPLLTITAPIGLQLGNNSGTITNQAGTLQVREEEPFAEQTFREQVLRNLRDTVTGGLQVVTPGETLALVGGDITLDNGHLTAAGGRIELGSLSEAGTVSINNDGSLSFPENAAGGNISLTNESSIDVRSGDGGLITVNARVLDLKEQSRFWAGIGEGLGTPDARGGDINLNVTDIISLDASFIFNNVFPDGEGDAGDTNISTSTLSLDRGSRLGSFTFGNGNAGNLTVEATNAVSISETFGETNNNRTGISNFVLPGAVGNTGNININTGSLSLENDTTIGIDVRGEGNGGVLSLQATDSIRLIGDNTFISSQVFIGGQGNAGSILIETGLLELQPDITGGGPALSTLNFGERGNAGNLIVNADRVNFVRGFINSQVGNLGQEIFTIGNGGEIDILARDEFSISRGGAIIANHSGVGNGSSVTIAADKVSLEGVIFGTVGGGILNQLRESGTGTGGDITIVANQLEITNGAQLNANSEGNGPAGNITVGAESIILDDNTQINAETVAGQGNIILTVEELILRGNSNITSNATGNVDGGNITITSTSPADFILLQENSNITANAVGGNGGNIAIESLGLFICSDCSITASSQFGLDGTLDINTVVTETFDTETLSQEVSAPEETVAQTCAKDRGPNRSFFIITGKGGIAPRPTDVQAPDDLIRFSSPNSSTTTPSSVGEENPLPQLVEATGWYVRSDGVVVLTAAKPNSQAPALTPPGCSGLATR